MKTEADWLAFWRRKATELLGYVELQLGDEVIRIEADADDVAEWKFTYYGEYR